MNLPKILTMAIALCFATTFNHAIAETMTWAETVQSKIKALDLSDVQKTDINKAFAMADEAYDDAFATARKAISETLTDEQKQKLGDMANAEIQRRMEGNASARSKSIAEIGEMIGITSDQSDTLKKSMGMLGDSLDSIDAKLMSQIKSILNDKQLAQIASWLS